MSKKQFVAVMLSILCLGIFSFIANAAEITTCTFDRNAYNQGETGYLTVNIYNDEESKIRVTELTATIDYYYSDDNPYIQSFFTSAELPIEVGRGESEALYIPFSLPTNIAPGYTNVYVKARTEIWNEHFETWYGSDHPTYYPTLYVESPYKEFFETSQELNQQLHQEIQDLDAVNKTTTNMMYMLGFTTMVFAAVAVLLLVLSRRAKIASPPTA
ncbi:MAG: hypothetical protein JSV64_02815 [Candidatus Bathyarchaeota archaeon]|nr:MAG: hypothetical protein JSV64_02815 [Candidatus Bathyarchaeota archaeon]